MKLPSYMQAQTEWVMHTEYPDLRDHDEIAIDLETKDTYLKSLGSGAVVGRGELWELQWLFKMVLGIFLLLTARVQTLIEIKL